MSWKETCAMEERVKFIAALLTNEHSMSELCRRAGVSRITGYKWWKRYQEGGPAALQERSRAPVHHPNAVAAQTVSALLELKAAQPNWGPEKLLDRLAITHPELKLPVISTAAAILRRHGLVRARRRRPRVPAYSAPFVGMHEPNAVWSIDFKGQFHTADGRWCYPLTLSDGFSRYLLLCQGLPAPTYLAVQRHLERAFRDYGLPWAIRSDNGTPFAARGLGGLSRLSVWWVKLGIRPERIAKGHPEQNGRHERMHWTLKQDTAMPPQANLRAQQRAFDRFHGQYNEERPHAALAKRTPAQLYRPSPRPYPARLPELEYASGFVVRRVCGSGEIKWRGKFVYLSQLLAAEPVGLYQIDDRHWRVYFGCLPLGILDDYESTIKPLTGHDSHH